MPPLLSITTTSIRPAIRRSIPHHFSSQLPLSQSPPLRTIKTSPSPPRKPAPSQPNPSYPAFSLQNLGATRAVKVVVIACLTVLGTIESMFWARVLWAKMAPVAEGEGKVDGE